MKSISPWMLIIIVVVVLLCMAGWSSHAHSSARTTWEYKLVTTYGPSLTNPAPNLQEFNELGAEGWELVAIRAGEFPSKDSKQYKTDYYFKRAK